jgi:hypothetical protein
MMIYLLYVIYKSGKHHTYEFKDENEARKFEYKTLKYNDKVLHYDRVIRKIA